MIGAWVKGIVAKRFGQVAIAAAGIVAATALIGTIGVFGASSAQTMTQRALTSIPVDWQIAIAPGADLKPLMAKLHASAAIRAVGKVGYADAAGLTTTTGETVQTTGAGQVLGLPPNYATAFPGQMRPLLGGAEGAKSLAITTP